MPMEAGPLQPGGSPQSQGGGDTSLSVLSSSVSLITFSCELYIGLGDLVDREAPLRSGAVRLLRSEAASPFMWLWVVIRSSVLSNRSS